MAASAATHADEAKTLPCEGQTVHLRSLRALRRALVAGILVAGGLAMAACGDAMGQASESRTGSSAMPHRRDPETGAALLRIARTLNNDFQENRDAAVYARWDAASRAIISKATYVQRHRECPSTPHLRVDTFGVTHSPDGAWLVHYSIGGHKFTDWWYYVRGRFVFDLPKSNPAAVALYELPPAQYVKELGCGH